MRPNALSCAGFDLVTGFFKHQHDDLPEARLARDLSEALMILVAQAIGRCELHSLATPER
ncbi:hypothetical protein AA309_05535 [Microvirga vignae]|uniref:Uncharacterized protein n=1 Tax=Microvirga vignae TaxID=1225564 RepID=A0A0H1RMR9_9HYPH|nr:hypothetical protein AA309_05535 [Microvirga vignae]